MNKERNPLWPWIVALLIGLPVMYIVSFGPACWLVAGPAAVDVRPIMNFYRPLGSWARSGDVPEWVSRTLIWWASLGLREGEIATVPMKSGLVRFNSDGT